MAHGRRVWGAPVPDPTMNERTAAVSAPPAPGASPGGAHAQRRGEVEAAELKWERDKLKHPCFPMIVRIGKCPNYNKLCL